MVPSNRSPRIATGTVLPTDSRIIAMHRRSFLASGAGALTAAGLLAGCLDRSNGSDQPEDGGDQAGSGLAPNPRDVEAPDADPSSFERLEVRGQEVPLVPIDVAHPWYLRQEARFVDARSRFAYDESHVAGAVSSPAPTGYASDDPTRDWPTDERIVTYCTCPHHLSSSRAAGLLEAGFENVYALDEGFGPWYERGYPVASANEVAAIGEARSIAGRVGASYAGEFVELRHEPTGQREPGEIGEDGSFEVTFRFVEVGPESTLTLETPAWTRTGSLSEFTSRTIR
jgi:rhodanese-related sulfurtransferase